MAEPPVDIVDLPRDALTDVEEVRKHFPMPEARPNQLEALQWILTAFEDYDNIILEMPVGSGKSAVAMGVARAFVDDGKDCYIVTHRKALQAQYVDSFALPVLYGRSSYFCRADGFYSKTGKTVCDKCLRNMHCKKRPCKVNEAPCTTQEKFLCEARGSCSYHVARARALNAPAVVMGSKYLFIEEQFVKAFGARDLMIFDECHRCEDEITGLIKYPISERMLREIWDASMLDTYQKGELPMTLYWYSKFIGKEYGEMTEEWFPEMSKDKWGNLTVNVYGQVTEPIVKNDKFPDPMSMYRWSIYVFETAMAALHHYRDAHLRLIELASEQLTPETSSVAADLVYRKQRFHGYYQRCLQLAECLHDDAVNFIIQEWDAPHNGHTVDFEPIWVSKYSRKMLDQLAVKKLFMSATVVSADQFCKLNGLDPKRSLFIRVRDSPFAVSNRPIYYVPVTKVSRKAGEEGMKKVCAAVQQIIDAHPDDRVLVLPYNTVFHDKMYYDLKAPDKMSTSQYKDEIVAWMDEREYPASYGATLDGYLYRRSQGRILTHGREPRERELAIKVYETIPNTVLLSTYLNEGYDGADDKLRVLIIPKIPFPDLGNEVVKRRDKEDKSWYKFKTVLSVVQQAGRGVRNERDYCKIFILDACFDFLLRENWRIIPKWFKEAIRRVKPTSVGLVPGQLLAPMQMTFRGDADVGRAPREEAQAPEEKPEPRDKKEDKPRGKTLDQYQEGAEGKDAGGAGGVG